MKKLALLVVFGCIAFASNAQNPTKIGYADPDLILSQMPDAKQIDTELKSLTTQYKNKIDAQAAEFQKKLKDYQDNINTMLPAIKENTERELQQLQANYEKLQQDAQTSIEAKRNQLLQPVFLNIGKAIEEVAKDNGYTLVINSQAGGADIVLWGDEKLDVSELVLKKLGITPKPAETTKTTQPTTTAQPTTPKPK